MFNQSELKPNLLFGFVLILILSIIQYNIFSHIAEMLLHKRVTYSRVLLLEIPQNIYADKNIQKQIITCIQSNPAITRYKRLTLPEHNTEITELPIPVIIKIICNSKIEKTLFEYEVQQISNQIKIHYIDPIFVKHSYMHNTWIIIIHIFSMIGALLLYCFHYKKPVTQLKLLKANCAYIIKQYFIAERHHLMSMFIISIALMIYCSLRIRLNSLEILMMSATFFGLWVLYYCTIQTCIKSKLLNSDRFS